MILWRALAALHAAIFCGWSIVARSFEYGASSRDRHYGAWFALLLASLATYAFAVWLARRPDRAAPSLGFILGWAAVYRVLLLGSSPILEIDIYRYLWDGTVVCQGVNPYRYAPRQVLEAAADDPGLPRDLRALAALRDASPVHADILQRIHYNQLTTIYPPVSLAVFAAADATSPCRLDVAARRTWLKYWLVAFDLATLAGVVRLLQASSLPTAGAIAYAWCPLVLKEFANSGHLDAIAVGLTTWAAVVAAECAGQRGPGSRAAWLAGGLLGLATGAKLYPLILLPWLAAWLGRSGGWSSAGRVVVAWGGIAALTLAPLLATRPWAPAAAPLPDLEGTDATSSSGRGLTTFFAQWEMNDFLFMTLFENVRPPEARSAHRSPWFAVTPVAWREALVGPLAARAEMPLRSAAFLVARGVTLAAFGLIAAWAVVRSWRSARVADWIAGGFLTVAWFWLLAPTQNPWYWTWAMPLVPFVSNRAWFAVSCVCMSYYLRFWLRDVWPEPPLAGTSYDGATAFDFIVVWAVNLPWWAWLLLERRAAKDAAGVAEPTEVDCGSLHRTSGA